MSNEVGRVPTAQEQFEANIQDRLRSDIGELLPDDVLSGLVSKAINDLFFKDVVVNSGSYSTRTEPSWFRKEVEYQMRTRIKDALDKYFETNEDKINEIIQSRMQEHAGTLFALFLSGKAHQAGMTFESQIMELKNDLHGDFQKLGLTGIRS